MKRLLSLFVLLAGCTLGYAQTIKNCGTVEQDLINRAKYPNNPTLDDLEERIQLKVKEIEAARRAGRIQATILTIPVVVHVIHTGESVGSGLNLSQAQVQAQLEVLNEDFRRMAGTPGFNNSPVGADIELEFCLSPVDENGNQMAEPGIDRVLRGNETWTKNQIESTLKPQTSWNPNIFYNIWTVDFGGEDNLLLGYAQFPDESGLPGIPGGGSASTDGVVVQYTSFGSIDKGNFPIMTPPYNHGRTLTHETGHWLGLRHIWGDGACGNDYVGDTPTHHAENRGCPTSKVSCDNVNVEMPQNYMDYSDDACMNIFTQGQKARILAVLELSPRRKQLVTTDLCSSPVTAPPVADFTADGTFVLRGGEVTFTDLSSNFPKEWEWTFENGDPSTSNVRNPKIKYTTPGKFKVSLKSTNSLGSSDVLTKEEYIEVSEEGLCGKTSNFKDFYTPSVIKISDFVDSTGYLTGHNSANSKAVSEYFQNKAKYKYISGVDIKFGKVHAATEGASVVVTLWNARGVQNAPGSIIEQKTVLLKQIIADVAIDSVTHVIFDRETPVFSRPYHVGIELKYEGDSLAIESSANNEATSATSWIQNFAGEWSPMAIAYGANIAMNISPVVGMNPSVQVSASKVFVNPGEEVILNARGASIFLWNSDDNTIQSFAGPQLIVNPVQTTTYEIQGSGMTLCDSLVTQTVYVRTGEITGVKETILSNVSFFPNPGTAALHVSFENNYRGIVQLQLRSILNQPIQAVEVSKTEDAFETKLDTSQIPPGVYITSVTIGESTYYGKWVKN